MGRFRDFITELGMGTLGSYISKASLETHSTDPRKRANRNRGTYGAAYRRLKVITQEKPPTRARDKAWADKTMAKWHKLSTDK